jgi:hypothetical protein
MRALSKILVMITASVALASCGGGGGGSGNGGIANPPTANLTVQSASSTSTPFSLVSVTVRATGSNGAALADGTQVTLRISPATVAIASHMPVNVGPNDTINVGETVTGTLSGGAANFRLHTRSVGTAQITASISNPGAPAQTVTASTNVAVNAGPGTDPRLTLAIQNPTIPVRPTNTPFFFPSLYSSLVTVTQRRLDGTLVNGSDDQGGAGGDEHCNGGGGAAAAIGTGLDFGALFLPAEGIEEDEETGEIEYFLCRSVSLGMNSGKHDFYVVSLDRQGPVELSVSAEDPQTGETLGQSFTFQVGGVPQVPASILINCAPFPDFCVDDRPLYILGTNGLHSQQLEILVLDGLGTPVPNPTAGVNNVVLEIVGGGQGGERVRGTNGVGQTVQGNSISIPSTNGIAPAQFDAGTVAHIVTLRATTDRADNNVDNGIQDPVTVTRTVTVSDGRVHTVQINGNYDVLATTAATSSPDGESYLLSISATLTDKFGKTVPAGTQVRFGLVDEPQENGVFSNAGNDGNPQELGTLFTAPTGRFLTSAGGPAGQNAVTLLVFAEEDDANFDMESARNITSVQSDTQLTVGYRFNANDGDNPGTSFDAFNLPYIIGRARDGAFVNQTGVTNAAGVATAVLAYPRGVLGKRIAIYAQANGEFINGTAELVSDVEFARFQGAGPLNITAPSAINSNRTETFDVCVLDGALNGLQGVSVTYVVTPLPGTTVNGSSASSGTIAPPTGVDGCVDVTVITRNILATGVAGTITFSAGGATAETEILGPTGLLLTANPSELRIGNMSSGSIGVTIRLTDNGTPIVGATIQAACTGTGITGPTAIGPTNSTGAAGATIDFVQPPAASGSCTFTAGTATVTVPIFSVPCTGVNSPPIPGCGAP